MNLIVMQGHIALRVCVCSNILLPFSLPLSPLPFSLVENAATDVSQGPGESLCLHSCVHIPFCQIVHVWPWVRHFPGDAKQNWSLNTLNFYWFRVRRNALNWWICIGFETKGMWFPCLCYHLLLINISGWIKKVESGHLLKIFLKDVLKICILQFNEHFALSSINLFIFYGFMWLTVEDSTYSAWKIWCGCKKVSFFLF